ncbi:hypothetical protein HG15A2_23760 [Adhaeretor mobilis]|uniref:Uncharacterized protein n=1 Tax=Adhaeretor mobilis TaxID=1930276 RepID=A0A517MW33_9BACT|nr:hypothetical protein HG15A2_23760 [Adhaeretor mobilis]
MLFQVSLPNNPSAWKQSSCRAQFSSVRATTHQRMDQKVDEQQAKISRFYTPRRPLDRTHAQKNGRSSSLACVPMVQPAQERRGDGCAYLRRLPRAPVWRIAINALMRAMLMEAFKVLG